MHSAHSPRPGSSLVAAVALAAGLLAANASAQGSRLPAAGWESDPRVLDATEARSRIDAFGSAPVIVTLQPTAEIAAFSDWRSHDRAEEHRARVRDLVEEVLLNVVSEGTHFRASLENTPVFLCTVNEAGLERLLQEPRVRAVRPDSVGALHTKQGIPQIGVSWETRTEYDGTGVSIAILDTGINYFHEALGASETIFGQGYEFPNEKVIGGYNPTGWTDSVWGDLLNGVWDFYAHGTSVAGIAAGDIMPDDKGDYVGGVAPGARLYALCVTGSTTQEVVESNTLLCLDWCVTHQDDDPENPILIVNFSAGFFRYYEDFCDLSEPDWDQTMTVVHGAGIAVFVSSGNEGFCDEVPVPACLSKTISVGATYDYTAELGDFKDWCVDPEACNSALSPFCSTGASCVDLWPRVGMPVCHSNVPGNHAVLDLVAPSYIARAPSVNNWKVDAYTDFSGTSASAPYASGAAAILQSYTRSWGYTMGVEELRHAMVTYGNPLPGGFHTPAPQVDVDAAIAGFSFDKLVVWVDPAYSGPELGTKGAPYTSLETAIAQVALGGQVWIKAGTYSIPATQAKPVSLRGHSGLVTLFP